MKAQPIVWLVVLVAGLAFVGGRLSTGTLSDQAPSIEYAETATTEDVASTASAKPDVQSLPTRARIDTVAPEPLPPVDQPLAESFDALLERTRHGDDRAACRLSVDLARCARRAQMASWSSSYERQAERTGDEARAQRMIDQVVQLDAALQ